MFALLVCSKRVTYRVRMNETRRAPEEVPRRLRRRARGTGRGVRALMTDEFGGSSQAACDLNRKRVSVMPLPQHRRVAARPYFWVVKP
eukprot:7391851-Prymnesium_polylepis.1